MWSSNRAINDHERKRNDVMSKKLSGQVAVVTGASKGIGAEIAKQLAAAGVMERWELTAFRQT